LPPSTQLLASVASGIAIDWAAAGSPSAVNWKQAVARSSFYDANSQNLAVNWDITTRRYVGWRSVVSSKTCRCTSKDGTVTHETTCNTPPDQCVQDTQDSDCSCKCAAK